jgi:hypothetical protein
MIHPGMKRTHRAAVIGFSRRYRKMFRAFGLSRFLAAP